MTATERLDARRGVHIRHRNNPGRRDAFEVLDLIVEDCTRADVPCRFVRRETDLDPRVVLGAAAE